jgi:type II secretory pathway component PulC
MRMAPVLLLIMLVTAPLLFGQPVFKYDAGNNRDPFRPLVDKDGNVLPEARPASAIMQLSLEGIVWSSGNDSYAIISGNVVKAGEILGDYKVVKINKNQVILNRGGEDIVLTRGEEE